MASALAATRAAIARAILGDAGTPTSTLGTITLRPQQVDAVARVRAAIAEFGGALLADEPGLGKTFVALAIARDTGPTVVAAPAALRAMWHDAASRAMVSIAFVSFETLSRRDLALGDSRPALVIVDEAHHVSNPAAARFGRLAKLTSNSNVLLLSATPVRNRRMELDALLSLFLGPRAAVLDEAARSRCIVRRADRTQERPNVVGPRWVTAPESIDLAAAIRMLPPPLPALDGREARALLSVMLVRFWASSLAALHTALTRRLQRGAAFDAILEAGRMPTRAELRAWVVGDDAVQLAFPLFVEACAADADAWRTTLSTHLDAVRSLRKRISALVVRDAADRARVLLNVRGQHPGMRIVAFTAFATTAEALFRELRHHPGVALLTAHGARTASGSRPRADILLALGPDAERAVRNNADNISLVVTTDVLSEGVNLQGAGVVVHLDLPWTPAALEQRIGRVARIGSLHMTVFEYGIAPPPRAARALAIESVLARKRVVFRAAVQPSDEGERLRNIVLSWGGAKESSMECDGEPVSCRASRNGFLAVVADSESTVTVAGLPHRSGFVVSVRPCDLLAIAMAATNDRGTPRPADVNAARAALIRWINARQAEAASGLTGAASRSRRAVLQRANKILASARPHDQTLIGRDVARLRAAVAQAIGAGAENALGALATTPARSERDWLRNAAPELECAHPARGTRRAVTTRRVSALLLLTLSDQL
jgi:superfamily II DNA or RNA helicase